MRGVQYKDPVLYQHRNLIIKTRWSHYWLTFVFENSIPRKMVYWNGCAADSIQFCQYRNSHCGDKRILRPPLHNEISYTGKMAFLYWITAWGCLNVNISPILPVQDSHYKDKPGSRQAYLYGGTLYQERRYWSYWNGATTLTRCGSRRNRRLTSSIQNRSNTTAQFPECVHLDHIQVWVRTGWWCGGYIT